jgi:hypothetical protein
MTTLPSSQFKMQYAKLTEPTTVTVNGHPIGTWTPTGVVDSGANWETLSAQLLTAIPNAPRDPTFDGILPPTEPKIPRPKTTISPQRTAQAKRDAWLRGATK